MRIERLTILNFKNIQDVDFHPSPKINCFLGGNGMGKTNLLDAIYYLSFCKSFSGNSDIQCISHEADFALIQGVYEADNKIDELFCGLRKRQKKQFKKNKKEYDKLSEHIGCIPLILVTPSDSELIAGSGEERRRFLDLFLSQFDKAYLYALIRYNKALQQRNAILKNSALADDTLLQLWEEQLCSEGKKISEKRKAFIEQFVPIFVEIYQRICSSSEVVNLKYISHFDVEDPMTAMQNRKERDKILGYTTVGVHRDDLEMLIDGYPIRKEGSQGQNKTFVVALKLAQFDFLKKATFKTPLLLLDDIFDKLDSSRVEQIVKLVLDPNFGQIFITDTNREHLDTILSNTKSEYHLYKVENGSLTKS